MPDFLNNLVQGLRDRRGADMKFLCRHLLSERGEASQTALAREIIAGYAAMNASQRAGFYEMLCREFSPDESAIHRAASAYRQKPGPDTLARLAAAVEPPRQELIRRINTAPQGTATLVALRGHLAETPLEGANYAALDADLRHLFKSWFNRGFLRLERINLHTSALVLEKLIQYESVHEINGWPDLRRRLQSDRRCFAFFHPALPDEPIIFLEVALSNGLAGDLAPLLDINAPVLDPDQADTAIFYSINNCLKGLRGIPFGNFLIKQVVEELAAELPKIKTYSTLSPLPHFGRTLSDQKNEDGFTRHRLSRLLADYREELIAASGMRNPVDALFHLLRDPLAHREALARPLERLALAYLSLARNKGRVSDPVAAFHLSNGARIERINAFGNVRPYGVEASFGVTVNYRYVPFELEENHERFATKGQIRVSSGLFHEHKKIAEAWQAEAQPEPRSKTKH